MAKWSVCQTHNPAVQGLSTTLATCWICSQLSQVEILGHTFNSQLGASILPSCDVIFESFVSKEYLNGLECL